MNIKKLLLSQIEKVVFDLRYDFLYEDECGELLCQSSKGIPAGRSKAHPSVSTFALLKRKEPGS